MLLRLTAQQLLLSTIYFKFVNLDKHFFIIQIEKEQ